MTNEEREIITRFVERAAGAGAAGGSVPATGAAPAPIDPEADALLAELFTRHPEARYRITQTAFVQEHALAEAQNRINQLQYQLASARPAPPPASAPTRSGFFSGLLGGGPPPWNAAPAASPPPPQPAYAPGYRPGMFQGGGSGFLGSALTTAAGVAGGVVLGNALMGLLSPHAGLAGGNFAGPENVTIINEAASPWSQPGGTEPSHDPWAASQDPGGGFDPSQAGPDLTQAGFDPSQGGADPSQGDFDPGGFDPGTDTTGGFGGDDDISV